MFNIEKKNMLIVKKKTDSKRYFHISTKIQEINILTP